MLGYYEEEDILDDNEQAALVPMEGEKRLCILCNKLLGSMYSAKRHYVARHQTNQKVRCQICQKFYKNAQTRDSHMIQMHKISANMMKNAISMPSTRSKTILLLKIQFLCVAKQFSIDNFILACLE